MRRAVEFLFILCIGLVAGTLSGIVGFGSSIMLMPVLVIAFGPLQAVPIMAIAAVMARVKRADTPYEERRAVAYAIAKIDTDVGNALGIKDRAGMQFTASGDPTQMDCVDVATNTTSYLLVLKANGLITHHTVEGTMSKENLAKGLVKLNPVAYWPHWSAILKENKSGQKYAVDRWPFDQGENPAIVKVEDWYIKDTER